MLDLHASIEPGRSAAGFELGQLLSDIEPLLENTRKVDHVEGFNLNAVLAGNKGALLVRGFASSEGVIVYFGSDIVRLVFSTDGRLGCIQVLAGYQGSYRGVQIGDALSSLSSKESLEFDDGDEMYYRIDADGQHLPGFAVIARESDVSEHASTSINGYSVHDWRIFRAAP